MLLQIQELDAEIEKNGISAENIRQRSHLEQELEDIMGAEEIYWQQRGGEKWILEGDSNSKFFHLANGRRRRKKSYHLNMRGRLSLTLLRSSLQFIPSTKSCLDLSLLVLSDLVKKSGKINTSWTALMLKN